MLWLATVLGLVAAGLPLSGSAYLGLAVACVIPVFAGQGAVVSQLASSRRLALELGLGAVSVFFLLRVIADTATGAAWLSWITPLGWAERLVLLAPGIISILLVALSARLQAGRDIGTGLLSGRSSTRPHLALLSSPTRLQAFRCRPGERWKPEPTACLRPCCSWDSGHWATPSSPGRHRGSATDW